MTTLKHVLKCAGFSVKFCDMLDTYMSDKPDTPLLGPKGTEQPGYLVVIDEVNLLRFVLEDFTLHGKNVQSLSYTNVPIMALSDDDLKDVEEINLKTCTVGPGFHTHKKWPVYFCYENTEVSTTITKIDSHKYVNRAALISLTSLESLQEYIESVKKKNKETKLLKRYTVHDMEWEQDMIPLRKADTLFLGDLWTNLYADAQDFFSEETKKFYIEHGISYVRSYLFHGHPGNGKSACIRTLASELGVNLYSLNLSMARLDDMALIDMMSLVHRNSIVAIEDIDRIFDNHSANQSASSVSFATFLNILDGTLAKDGIMFILTCNAFDQLDEALCRSGRIDKILEFPDANLKTAEKMFLSFYPEHKTEAKKFVNKLNTLKQVPVAAVQEFFLKNRKRKAEELLSDVEPSLFKSRRKTNVLIG
jgi:chaperone BCS1